MENPVDLAWQLFLARNALWIAARRCRSSFAGIRPDQEKRAKLLSRPAPERRYAIFFTPRSGSSRLTEMCEGTGVLGRPGEALNPAFLPTIAERMQADTPSAYFDTLGRMRAAGGTFGLELTYLHLRLGCGSERAFLDALRPTAAVWLLREDIVAQAVSLSRMLQTDIAHSLQTDDRAQHEAETVFRYDRRQILSQLMQLLWLEIRTERMFARHGIAPLRLSYERVTHRPEAETLAGLAGHIGVTLPAGAGGESRHTKLSGEKAAEFAGRFRTEESGFVRRIHERRQAWLGRL